MRRFCLFSSVLLLALPVLGQQLTVLAPNGGEVWAQGSTQNIRWDQSGFSGGVNIILLKDGLRAGVIADDVAASAKVFTWTVGNIRGGTAAPGTGYKVRLKRVGADLSDDSNQAFEISTGAPPPPAATVSLTSPDGGESWVFGEWKSITWTYSGPSDVATLSLIRNGQDMGIIASSLPAASGSYRWQVGSAGGTSVPACPGYRVRIRIGPGVPADESGGPFTITAPVVPPDEPPVSAAGIVLDVPAGGESWVRGSTQTLRWTPTGIGETLSLVLFKGETRLGTIVEGLSGSSTSQLWRVGDYQGGTAPFGEDYFIQVISRSGSRQAMNRSPFAIRDLTARSLQAEIRIAPRLLSFAIDAGAERTEGRTVTLEHRVMGDPTHYRVRSERAQQEVWSDWLPYLALPSFTFPEDGCGPQTLGFQLKNDHGESGILTDTIAQETKKEYRLKACAAKNMCWSSSEWIFRILETDCGRCAVLEDRCISPNNYELFCRMNRPFGLTGGKAEFELFGGRQLNEGWEFVAYEYECFKWEDNKDWEKPSTPSRDYRFVQMPSPGSRDITLRVRIWADLGTATTFFYVKSVTLKGPCNRPVEEAFR